MSSGPGVVSNERLVMKEILVSSVYSFVILYFLFIVATVLIIIIIFHNRITATGHHKTIIILVMYHQYQHSAMFYDTILQGKPPVSLES